MEQITAQMKLTMIVVIPHLLVIVRLKIHVVKMKEIVILIMNAKQTLSAALIIVAQHILDLPLI